MTVLPCRVLHGRKFDFLAIFLLFGDGLLSYLDGLSSLFVLPSSPPRLCALCLNFALVKNAKK